MGTHAPRGGPSPPAHRSRGRTDDFGQTFASAQPPRWRCCSLSPPSRACLGSRPSSWGVERSRRLRPSRSMRRRVPRSRRAARRARPHPRRVLTPRTAAESSSVITLRPRARGLRTNHRDTSSRLSAARGGASDGLLRLYSSNGSKTITVLPSAARAIPATRRQSPKAPSTNCSALRSTPRIWSRRRARRRRTSPRSNACRTPTRS